jgi:cyd operon protein YbgT
MWYFTWILGVFLALSLGIINVMWYEAEYPGPPTGDSSP